MRRFVITYAGLPLLGAILVLGPGCIRTPTEKPVYREARRAIEAIESLPTDAKVQSIAKSKLYIGKSAARADLLVKHTDASGSKLESWYTVPLKRVARTWVAQNVSLRPDASSYAEGQPRDRSDLLTP